MNYMLRVCSTIIEMLPFKIKIYSFFLTQHTVNRLFSYVFIYVNIYIYIYRCKRNLK